MNIVDVIVPVYNEEKALEPSVLRLRDFLNGNMPGGFRITVADNGSTDSTASVARGLAARYPDVALLHLDQKGRGRALRKAWLESTADIVAYMDVDLSTDLNAFPLLVRALQDGYDIAIGSRLLSGAQVQRSFKREFLSRGYNLMIRALFWTSFHDAQCGFKALWQRTARELIPLVKDQNWFFDTELLLVGARRKCRIKEVPVKWVEGEHTTVHIRGTVLEDVKGLLRVRFGGRP